MKFDPLAIDGAIRVRTEPHRDARGYFERIVCAREFAEAGLPTHYVQASVSASSVANTRRGMHWQWPPSGEGKLVRCLRGRMFDAMVDLRPDSPSYLASLGLELDGDRHDAVYLPAGVAHGFQTLAPDTEVLYQMTDYHAPALAAGYRCDDRAFGIDWPAPAAVTSDRDRSYADFDVARHEAALTSHRATASGAGW